MVFKSTKKEDTNMAYVRGQADAGPREIESGSLIGEGVKIKGTLNAEEDVIIEGKVEGNIKVSKILTVGKKGEVLGEINADTVRVKGFVKGNTVAGNRLEILSQGRCYGNLKSKILVVEEGAILIGDVNKETVGKRKTKEPAGKKEKAIENKAGQEEKEVVNKDEKEVINKEE